MLRCQQCIKGCSQKGQHKDAQEGAAEEWLHNNAEKAEEWNMQDNFFVVVQAVLDDTSSTTVLNIYIWGHPSLVCISKRLKDKISP